MTAQPPARRPARSLPVPPPGVTQPLCIASPPPSPYTPSPRRRRGRAAARRCQQQPPLLPSSSPPSPPRSASCCRHHLRRPPLRTAVSPFPCAEAEGRPLGSSRCKSVPGEPLAEGGGRAARGCAQPGWDGWALRPPHRSRSPAPLCPFCPQRGSGRMPALGLSVSGTRLSCGAPGAAARLPGCLPGPGHPSAVAGTGEGPAPRCCRSWLRGCSACSGAETFPRGCCSVKKNRCALTYRTVSASGWEENGEFFVSETGLFRLCDGVNYREFSAGFLCLRAVSGVAFLAGEACSAFHLAAGPGEPLSLCWRSSGRIGTRLSETDGIAAGLAAESSISQIGGMYGTFPFPHQFH